jgi:hypothetical protein
LISVRAFPSGFRKTTSPRIRGGYKHPYRKDEISSKTVAFRVIIHAPHCVGLRPFRPTPFGHNPSRRCPHSGGPAEPRPLLPRLHAVGHPDPGFGLRNPVGRDELHPLVSPGPMPRFEPSLRLYMAMEIRKAKAPHPRCGGPSHAKPPWSDRCHTSRSGGSH